MNFLKSLFSSSQTVSEIATKTTDGVINSLDKLIFTDEEKSDMGIKTLDLYLKMQDKLADENTVRSITRRYLAVGIMFSYLFLIICSAFIYRINSTWSQFIFDCAKSLNTLVLAVGCLYFGPYQFTKLFKDKSNDSES